MTIEIDALKDVVELTLQSNFLKPYIPVSLMLIAKPETGKTTVLSFAQTKDFVYYTNEVTAKMLIDWVLPRVEKKELRTIVIPDLLNCIEKQKSTRQQFLMFIKSAIEEGFTSISTFHKQYTAKKPTKLSMITAITSVDFAKTRKYLQHTGLLSRFIPFSYDYPITKIKQILEAIEQENAIMPISYKLIKRDTVIEGDPVLFKQFELISRALAQQYDGYGFRSQVRLQQLAKANALLNKRKKVTQEDIDKVTSLSDWMNFDFNMM